MEDLVRTQREQILRLARRHGVTEQLLGRRVQVVTERGLDVLHRARVRAEAVPL